MDAKKCKMSSKRKRVVLTMVDSGNNSFVDKRAIREGNC
jgi:hypothetical protein